MNIFSKIFGGSSGQTVKHLQPVIDQINSLEPEIQKLSAEQLKEKTQQLKEKLSQGKTLNDLLPEAFALVREAARRTLNQRHFDVQLIGGAVLHQGTIAEMRTGEGKTLSATLPAYLNALEGKGVHVVTVNDYLAKRDMVWMGQIYNALGLSVGCVVPGTGYRYDVSYKNEQTDKERDMLGGFKIVEDYLRPVSKKEAYDADITYGTNHEFGFDYLRDNMVYELSQKSQRGFHFAIVDEVDSILIDEARVPLIISGQAEDATQKYAQFTRIVAPLEKDQDYQVDEKAKTVSFTEAGQNKVIAVLGHDPWLENDIATTHQLETALKAKTLFLKNREYVIKNGEVLIVDEFTGRTLPGRRWSGGLHQAIEAKERVAVQPESTTLGTITFQNYFRLYQKLSGMTGTALTSAEEFDKVYGLDVVVIPTHRPMIRKDTEDKIYKNQAGKFKAIVAEIKRVHETGQPILIGTGGVELGEKNVGAIEKNLQLKDILQRQGIACTVLNAIDNEKEGEVIAQAGKQGAVTIATNMAGRGVDILLGGNPPDAAQAAKVRELGGLHVISIERNGSRRVDNQLRGRAGRQGDPGSSQFFVSLEDDLMRIFGGDRIQSLMNTLNVPEDEPIQAKVISRAIESAQAKIEGFNFDTRHHLLEYDDVMNKHREIIYKKRNELLEQQNIREHMIELLVKAGFSAADYEKREAEVGADTMTQVAKYLSLKVIDTLWQDHLSNMEHMRDSVRLRAYGGQDPLVEYKNEGQRLFRQMLDDIDHTIANNILKAGIQINPQPAPAVMLQVNQNHQAQVNDQEIGRNDLCPCGSGKKWKRCGMINSSEHQKNMAKKQ